MYRASRTYLNRYLMCETPSWSVYEGCLDFLANTVSKFHYTFILHVFDFVVVVIVFVHTCTFTKIDFDYVLAKSEYERANEMYKNIPITYVISMLITI
jgi:hypothetical protein